MRKSYLLIILALITSCFSSEKTKTQDCSKLEEDFSALQSSIFKNCVVSCIKSQKVSRTLTEPSKNPVEASKEGCSNNCREKIPFSEINSIKESINTIHGCSLNHKRSF